MLFVACPSIWSTFIDAKSHKKKLNKALSDTTFEMSWLLFLNVWHYLHRTANHKKPDSSSGYKQSKRLSTNRMHSWKISVATFSCFTRTLSLVGWNKTAGDSRRQLFLFTSVFQRFPRWRPRQRESKIDLPRCQAAVRFPITYFHAPTNCTVRPPGWLSRWFLPAACLAALYTHAQQILPARSHIFLQRIVLPAGFFSFFSSVLKYMKQGWHWAKVKKKRKILRG